MLDARCAVIVRMPARLQDVVKADEIGLDVSIRVGDGVAHACLGGKIYDDVRPVLGEDLIDQRFVGEVAPDEGVRRIGVGGQTVVDFGKSPFFDVHIVVIVHIVHSDDGDGRLGPQKLKDQIAPDKSGGAGDEYSFMF